MSSINQFPWQDEILRTLRSSGGSTIDELSEAASAEGVDSDQLREAIAENVDHLVHLGLAEYAGGGAGFERAVKLTASGESAADSLP